MIDDNNGNTDTATSPDTTELAQFRAWRESRLRETALAEGRNQASAEHQAAELAADSAALKKLSDRGVSLRDAFGASSTNQGRGTIINLHRSGFGSKSDTYSRLRRLARLEGLVK